MTKTRGPICEKRHAGAYLRRGRIYVYSEHKTVGGALIAQDDVVSLDSTDFKGIAEAVKNALQAYRMGVPIPPRESLSGTSWKMYAVAGVRKWSDFVKGAKGISIRSENGQITLTPMRNRGARGGFDYIVERAHSFPETFPSFGEAVVLAFSVAE
jgi:hypothetical protein